MDKIRLWICPECGLKYMPQQGWDKVCKDDGTQLRMSIEEPNSPTVTILE